jgi:hypothetical protein
MPTGIRQDPLAALHEETLEHLRRCWHRELAAVAALNYCRSYELNPPSWLIEATESVLCSYLTPKSLQKRGRASGSVARYLQDMVDYERWDVLREVRENQRELRQQVERLRAIRPIPQLLLKEREKLMFWVGSSWLRAYECASMMLAQTASRGGPDAIKASYLRVTQNSRDPTQATRYYRFEPAVESKLGLRRPALRPRSGITNVPLYELVL